MKYVISESRLDEFIYKYLNSFMHPDYGWQDDKWYKESVERWGDIVFEINDKSAYSYFLGPNKYSKSIIKPNTLHIETWVVNRLNNHFGDRWKPIFVKWFQENTGLPVENTM